MTGHIRLLVEANEDNFEESAYLRANPDVAQAVAAGTCPSGRAHFDAFASTEGRCIRLPIPPEWKQEKLGRIAPLLKDDAGCRATTQHLDCLTDALREEFRVIPTDNVSAHEYDREALALIERHPAGLILDCGAGLRNTYYRNVVNYEIVAYDSTDVLGVAERLPFKDDSFDAVMSMNVLEHVKDPFQAARELMRVLKPGGELMCVAPFLQPLHGYPHHYYNMTAQGLDNLFSPLVERRISVYGAMQPFWALNWFLARYSAGLSDELRERFQRMTVAELLTDPEIMQADPIVMNLAPESRTELASAHALIARKPTS